MLKNRKIGVIGGGKMGSVLIHGILARGLVAPGDVIVADVAKDRLVELSDRYGIATTEDNGKAVRGADVIILAVKPQILAEVLEGIAVRVTPRKLIVSIAAGVSTGFIEGRLGKGARVIRVMPNTPALVGEGMTALAGGSKATTEDLALVRHMFDAIGLTVEVREDLMDAVTGLSGSGPAYVFVIVEALADAGVLMGLGRDVALKLAAQTLRGAAKLCLEGEWHPAQLKDMVTSPGGTTIAGLQALEEGKLRATLMAAVEKAALRSRQLGGR
ncbi:MAG: pyrroline-5-carboxylate reductase [Deltaproteobacteria bacterium]|nr:pyrroline-5-carboxylate reductase [Deltaproteobacteria bacterium]